MSPTISAAPRSVRSSISDNVEMSTIDGSSMENVDARTDTSISAIPPPDHGFAWIYLIAAFWIEFLAWGMYFSIGVLTEYWNSTLFPGDNNLLIALAATLQGGVLYASALPLRPLYKRYPQHRAKFQYAGLLLSVLGILLSAFVTAPWQLLITAGMIYPAGAGTCYLPAATLVFEWFAKRRGLAAAIVYSGTAVGGTVFPLLIQALLHRFSYKAALVSLSLGYALFGAVAVFFIRERIPVSRYSRGIDDKLGEVKQQQVAAFFRKRSFYAFLATVFFTSCGNFLPSLEMPTYAAAIGLSSSKGTALLSIMNASSVVGLLVFGSLSDRVNLKVMITISCIGASAASFVLWGFGTDFDVLAGFAIVWGVMGLGFTSLWTRMISIISGDDPSLPPLIFAIFGVARGLGSVISGPISSTLLKSGRMLDLRHNVYGVEGYGPVLLYVGSILALGSVTGVSA